MWINTTQSKMAKVWAYIEYQESGSMKIKLLNESFTSRAAAESRASGLGITIDNVWIEAIQLDSEELEDEKSLLTAKINSTSTGIYRKFLVDLRNRINFLLNLPAEPEEPEGPGDEYEEGDFFKVADWQYDSETGITLAIYIYYMNGEWWPVRATLDHSEYAASGGNILDSPNTININIPEGIVITTEDTDLNGLFGPAGFPSSNFLSILGSEYELSDGVFVRKSTIPEPGEPGDSGIIDYQLPVGNNTTNWPSFGSLIVPVGMKNVLGYGGAMYADEPLIGGKLAMLSKGWTNVANLSAYPRSRWDGKNAYGFQQMYYMVNTAAERMIAHGKNGGEWGDIAAIVTGDLWNTNINFTGVTTKGVNELGKYNIPSANSIDDSNWDIDATESVFMIDEESMSPKSWIGGDLISFIGYFIQGMYEGSGNKLNIFMYGQPISRWWHVNHWTLMSKTKAEIEAAFTSGQILFNTPGWKAAKWFVDANGAYSRVPFLSNIDIYEKVGGSFVIVGGKRKFRDENFPISIYGKTETILREPDDQIKYAIINYSTGEQRFGTSIVDIHEDGSASIKASYVSAGFEWHPIAQPYPSSWKPETNWFVTGIYQRADGIMADQLGLRWLEHNSWTTNTKNQQYLQYGEHRPKTENWTYGGNSTVTREVGESQIFFDTLMLLLSGGMATSTWDDGYWKNELPNNGGQLYGQDDYWGRYHSRLASVQTILKPLEGTNPMDWVHIHFYYPYWGQINSEVISSGIYYNGKLHLLLMNPTLENGESQAITLRAGAIVFNETIVGHEVYFRTFDVPTGLGPNNFKLEYTTIYGRYVKVNGKVTNSIDSHYEM